MRELNIGDKVRGPGISGEISKTYRKYGEMWADVSTANGMPRSMPCSGLTVISRCENATIVYDTDAKPVNIGFGDRYPVRNLIPCTNAPEIVTNRGRWYCKACSKP